MDYYLVFLGYFTNVFPSTKVNDYYELWRWRCFTLKLASRSPKVACLNEVLSEKKKRARAEDLERELNIALIDACHKLSEVEG